MTDMQPTPDGGASVTERLEAFLAAGDEKETKPAQEEASGDAAPEGKEATEVEESAKDAQEEEEGPQLELSDVAKILGVDESALDVDEDGSLKVKTKIDGKEGAAKLNDLLKSYQLQGHVDERVRRAADQEKQLAERMSQVEHFAQAGMQRLDTLANAAQQMLMAEYQSVNWDRMVQEDPIGYTEKRHQFEQRQGQLGQLMQHVESQRRQFSEAYQWKQAQAFQSEAQRLSTLVPEWTDEKVRDSERVELAKWLTQKGASEQSISGIVDAGMVAALRAGMVAERSAPKVAATDKKVRAAPRLVRPGSPIDAGQREGETVRGLKDKIRRSGGKEGVTEYLIRSGIV